MSRQEYANPPQHFALQLHNLRCSSDTQVVERVLRRQPGVVEVYANPVTERVHVLYDAALTQPEQLRAVLRQSGFGPRKAHASHAERRRVVDGSSPPRHRR